MKVIKKYIITVDPGIQKVEFPIQSKIVFIESEKNGYITLFVEGSPEHSINDERAFQVYSNGEYIPDDAQHMYTSIQYPSDPSVTRQVFHLYERLSRDD